MARTYSNVPVLSKMKVGDNYYYLKDGDARAILDSIQDDVYAILQNALGTVAAGGDHLVSAGNIKSYVDAAMEAALEIVVLDQLPQASESAWNSYHNAIVLVPKGESQTDNIKDEYIIVRSGEQGAYTYAWEKIGDTEIDLSGYVTDVKWVDNGHKLQQKKGANGEYADIHAFGDMADADTASVTVNDYVTGVSSAKVTAEGSVSSLTVIDSVGSAPSFSEGAFTPNIPTQLDLTKFDGGEAASLAEGFATAGSAAQFTEGAFTPNVPTALDLTKFDGGSKVADQFTAASIQNGFATAGSAASFTEGAFTPASLTTQTKALYKQGVKAEVGTGADAECLIFSNVDKEADIKVVDTFDGGSKAADTFVANVPTAVDVTKFNGGSFSEGAFTPASLASGFYTAGSAASKAADSFTPNVPTAIDVSKFDGGEAASLSAGFYTVGSAASKVADTWNAGSVPTTKSVTPTFTGSEVDATVTLAKGSKTIVVSPDAGE